MSFANLSNTAENSGRSTRVCVVHFLIEESPEGADKALSGTGSNN